MKEIVSVQVGGFANFVGAHFWNIQDEFLATDGHSFADPDVFHRTGDSGIITPRLLSIDLPGSLGSSSSHGLLASNNFTDSSSPHLTWTGKFSIHAAQSHPKNLFLQRLHTEISYSSTVTSSDDAFDEISDEDIVENLEKNTRFWTDFSKVQYHPRSLYQISGVWSDSEQEFDNYGIGKDVFIGCSMIGEDLNDRLRFFIEECDYFQGIQFTIDDSGGFAGLAAEFLENIADEYMKIPVMIYTSRPPCRVDQSGKHLIRRRLHDAISFSRLSSLSDLIVPTGLSTFASTKCSSFLHIDDGNPYHCAAVFASAFHSASFPFQMHPQGLASPSELGSPLLIGHMEMNAMVQNLCSQTRTKTLGILDAAIPPSPLSGDRFESSLFDNLQPLMPDISIDNNDPHSVDFINVRGILESGVDHTAPIHRVEKAVLSEYDNSASNPKNSHISAALCPLPIPLPFPSIFAGCIGHRVKLLRTNSPSGSTVLGPLDVGSIPIATRLRAGAAALPFLHKRLADIKRYGTERGAVGGAVVNSWGFEKEELVEMEERMVEIVKALDFGSFVSSDSD